jgi:formate/nitrite transporter FocA (FNT family)
MYTGAVNLGSLKASTSAANILRLGLITGAFIGFGACFAMTVTGSCPTIQQADPGLNSMIYASLFPMGMMMTTITGGELFTGNTALVFTAWAERRIKLKNLLKSWSLSYVANFFGSIIFAALIMKSGILATNSLPFSIATAKVALPFDVAFTRAILCNWVSVLIFIPFSFYVLL